MIYLDVVFPQNRHYNFLITFFRHFKSKEIKKQTMKLDFLLQQGGFFENSLWWCFNSKQITGHLSSVEVRVLTVFLDGVKKIRKCKKMCLIQENRERVLFKFPWAGLVPCLFKILWCLRMISSTKWYLSTDFLFIWSRSKTRQACQQNCIWSCRRYFMDSYLQYSSLFFKCHHYLSNHRFRDVRWLKNCNK